MTKKSISVKCVKVDKNIFYAKYGCYSSYAFQDAKDNIYIWLTNSTSEKNFQERENLNITFWGIDNLIPKKVNYISYVKRV